MKSFVTLALGLTATYGVADSLWTQSVHATEPATDAEFAQTDMPVEQSIEPPVRRSSQSIPLSFAPPPTSSLPSVSKPPAPTQPKPAPATARSYSREDLFAGGSESIVARTVGAAEGTRTPDGGKTDIYEGHVDPGNGVWNRGTFSYQFGNQENLSSEEADRRQMAKIKRVYESIMLAKAEQQGLTPLTLAEEINGIDLINQAPLAVTENGGYIERLAEAKRQKGLTGDAAILEARVWAFWDSARGGWDAPGLRAYDDMGKEASVRHDQKRRMGMINQALAAIEQRYGAIAERQSPDHPASVSMVQSTIAASHSRRPNSRVDRATAEQRANQIILGAVVP